MGQIQKRMFFIGISFFILFLGLIIRLMDIQLLHAESFSKHKINLIQASVAQRRQLFTLDSGRGKMTDRNGESLLENEYPVVILFPFLKHEKWPKKQLAAILHVEETTLEQAVEKANKPFVFEPDQEHALTKKQVKKIEQLNTPGIVVKKKRQAEAPIAQALIGLVGQDQNELMRRYAREVEKGRIKPSTVIGKTGLQHSFDPFLISKGETVVSYQTTNRGQPLQGLNKKHVGDQKNQLYIVQTTIDKTIQQQVEMIMDEQQLKSGGVLLLDVETNSTLALSQRPNHFQDSFHLGRNQLIERQIPGSIFKTVIAAAAIEQLDIDEKQRFDCRMNVRGEKQDQRNLGYLSFDDSYTQSCNRTFAQLGVELQKKDQTLIETYAKQLGLLERVSWSGSVFHDPNFSQLAPEEEETGQVFLNEQDRNDKRMIELTSIGQNNVRVTPLAVANMMSTIAREGDSCQVRFVQSIHDESGAAIFEFPSQKLIEKPLHLQTVKRLKQMMRQVVVNERGTAHALHQLPYAVAGKTGTAQIGTGNGMQHWFAGFFPYEEPKYALVVIDTNYENGSQKTFKVTEEIVRLLYGEDNKQKRP